MNFIYLPLHKVFYIDSTGALCSRASGHAIDIVGKPILHSLQISRRVDLNNHRPPTRRRTRPPPQTPNLLPIPKRVLPPTPPILLRQKDPTNILNVLIPSKLLKLP